MKQQLHIAIDGPVAAGKGTVAAKLAQRLGILYVDTGAMYRCAALLGLRNKANLENESEILDLLEKNTIRFQPVNFNHQGFRLLVKEEDVTEAIRTQEVSQASSIVATLPKVREFMVSLQQKIAKNHSVIMEGRDITTKVLPMAQVKIFLTADQVIRARRRQQQLADKGVKLSFTTVLEGTKERDQRDTKRKASPLQVIPTAHVIDTTSMTIEEVVEKILSVVRGLNK